MYSVHKVEYIEERFQKCVTKIISSTFHLKAFGETWVVRVLGY
jgi:hypothetical protein